MREYTLNNPLIELTFDADLSRFEWLGLLAAWLLFSIGVVVTLLYLYAVVFYNIVGFETALLVGIGLIALNMGDK